MADHAVIPATAIGDRGMVGNAILRQLWLMPFWPRSRHCYFSDLVLIRCLFMSIFNHENTILSISEYDTILMICIIQGQPPIGGKARGEIPF